MSVNLNSNKTLFVFYTLSSTRCFWTYKTFPNGWEWVGSGRTSPIGSKKDTKYTHEEQFSGPGENKEEMKKFLEDTFKKLKEENSIDCFKIKQTYA
jgi:hypothetical protein